MKVIAVELAYLVDVFLELRVVAVALGIADGGELAGVKVEYAAVGDADLCEDFGVSNQEIQGLPIRELIDRKGVSPYDAIRRVNDHDQGHEADPFSDTPTFLHCSLRS